MSIDPTIISELTTLVGAKAIDQSEEGLIASSHDTWPLSTKQAMVGKHPHQAELVVNLSSFEHVPDLLAIATRAAVPVTVRGLGSSVTGQPLPVAGGIVLDVSTVPPTYSVDVRNMTVTATASLNGGTLEGELNKLGYTLGHSPQSLYRSTVGGWVSTLATGQFSSMYGGIEDLVTAYVLVLATGESVRLAAAPRAAMGPDLRQIFIGSEGTLGVITEVSMKIFPATLDTALQTYALPTVEAGIELMRDQALLGLRPFLLRFYDTDEARHALRNPQFETPVLFVGSRGPTELVEAEMRILDRLARERGGEQLGASGAASWMERRFDFSTVENLLKQQGGFAETIEVAHTWSGIDALYAELKEALAPLADEVLVHFSHVYTQGTSMYVILLGQVPTDEQAVTRLRTIWDRAMEICLQHGAELSHHHGGGLARSPYTKRSLGTAHIVLRKLKSALDPAGILNPGKLGL